MAVFIKNTTPYAQTFFFVRSSSKDSPIVLNDIEKEIVFPTYLKDAATGQVIETGFTELDDADYNRLLKEVPLFESAIKSGRLIKYDEAPPEALKDAQLLEKARQEAEALKQRIAELESVLTAPVAAEEPKKTVKKDVKG